MKRVVLITGAGRRIGAAIARDLAAKDWHPIVHYNRSETEARRLAAEIEQRGGSCGLVQADLADPHQVARLVPDCVQKFGAIECLINNAALFSYDNIEKLDRALWDKHLATNLTAPAFLCRDFSKQADASAVIINMLDQKVRNVNPDFLSYTVSKIALDGLTRVLAMALAPKIRVCGIAPGVTLISGKQTPQSYERSVKATPLGRSSTPDDVVAAVNFILSVASLTGQVISIDGGESLTGRRRDVAFDVP